MRIVHLVSTAKRRGAEVFAADLVRVLAGEVESQGVIVLWAPTPFEVDFGAAVTALGGAGGGPSGWWKRVAALRSELAASRPDLVLAHGGDALEHAVLADPRGRIPVVYRNIGLAHDRVTRGPRRALFGALVRRAGRVIAVADAVAHQTIEAFHTDPEVVVTIPNGVDAGRLVATTARGDVRRGLGISERAPVVLFLGALSWEKDPVAFVELAARIAGADPHPHFLVVGDGPLRAEVEAGVSRSGVAERIHLLGNRPDVADLLAAGDVLVLVSRPGGMEGMPAVLIEAGLAGLPVVAHDVAGVAEVVEHGVTGLLVRPGDVDGLFGAVRSVLDDADRRARLGAAARTRCAERFDLGGQLALYLEVFAAVTGAGRGRWGR